ncbi:MAG: CPBP family intramembrane metalloprotease [Candidatus Hydrogenedentota bacterium]|nr:MAG: CPBP family intramembrane metalloprotease [Candidatus Hydrogenedentota bacterium]
MKQHWRVPAICITASILLIIYHYEGKPAFFDAHLASRFVFTPSKELYRYLYSFGATFVVLGLLPAAVASVLWDDRPSEWGLALGRRKLAGLVVSLLLFAAMLPVLAYASTLPSVSDVHPLSKLAAKYQKPLVIYETCLFLHLAGWEFFFRGFLLFGLGKRIGDAAIYFQVLPCAVMHLGKPQVEALGAIPTGIALGYLASRTGSVWYGVVLHWLCALTLDIFVIYRPL